MLKCHLCACVKHKRSHPDPKPWVIAGMDTPKYGETLRDTETGSSR